MVSLNIKKISEPLIPMAISWSNDYDGKYGEIIDMSQAVPSYPPHPKLIEEFINSSSVKSLLNYGDIEGENCLLYTSPSPRDLSTSRMPSSA